MDAIKRWLAAPVFAGDLEKTRQAALINLIGISSIAFILLIVVGSLLGKGTPPTSTLMLDFLACLVMAQFVRWLRRGRVALARFGVSIFGLVYITVVNASLGTINTPTTSVFVFWVLMTGLLFDLPGILFGVVAASLAAFGLIVAENLAWLPAPYRGVAATQWITFTALFGFTGGLTYYVTLGTRKALTLAEKALALAEQEIVRRCKAEAALMHSEQRYRSLVE